MHTLSAKARQLLNFLVRVVPLPVNGGEYGYENHEYRDTPKGNREPILKIERVPSCFLVIPKPLSKQWKLFHTICDIFYILISFFFVYVCVQSLCYLFDPFHYGILIQSCICLNGEIARRFGLRVLFGRQSCQTKLPPVVCLPSHPAKIDPEVRCNNEHGVRDVVQWQTTNGYPHCCRHRTYTTAKKYSHTQNTAKQKVTSNLENLERKFNKWFNDYVLMRDIQFSLFSYLLKHFFSSKSIPINDGMLFV